MEKTKVYKLEILFVDHEELGDDGVQHVMENLRYGYATVMSMKSKEVEWSDWHPLNDTSKCDKAFEELFSDE